MIRDMMLRNKGSCIMNAMLTHAVVAAEILPGCLAFHMKLPTRGWARTTLTDKRVHLWLNGQWQPMEVQQVEPREEARTPSHPTQLTWTAVICIKGLVNECQIRVLILPYLKFPSLSARNPASGGVKMKRIGTTALMAAAWATLRPKL